MDGGLKEKKMNINIEIKGQQAHIVNQQSLISGTSNWEEIKFDFSSEWDGYTKTAVIYVDDYSISDSVKMLVEKDVVSAEKLPDWLFREECELYIGVFGDNSEGRRITSTIVCQKVKKGVPVDVVNEITPDIYNQIINIMSETKSLVAEVNEKVELNKSYLEQTQQKANEASESAMRAENSESNINATVNAFNDMSETKKIELINAADAKMADINSVIVPHMYSDEGEPLSDPENYKDIKVGDLYLSRTNNSVWYCYSVAEEEGIKTSCYWLKIQQNLGVGTNIEINSNVISVKDKPTFKGLYSVDERMEVTGGLTVGGEEETILGGEGSITVAGAGCVTFAKENGATFSKPVVTADELTANGVSTFNGIVTYNVSATFNGDAVFNKTISTSDIKLEKGKKSIYTDGNTVGESDVNIVVLGEGNNIIYSNRSMVLGDGNDFDTGASKSLVVGDENSFSGKSQGLIFGNNNELYSASEVAIGDKNTVSGPFGKSFGVSNQAVGFHSTAIGSNNLAGGNYSLMIGSSCQGTSNYAVAIGEDNQAYENQFVIGKHNKIVTNGELFVVGNGASDTERSNALWLTKDGDLHIAGQLYSAGLEDYTMIKHATEPAVEDTMLGKYLDIPTNKYNEIIFVISGELKGDGYSDKIGLAKNKTSFEETIPAGNTTVNTIFRVKKLTDSKCLMELNGYNTQITKVIERDGSLIISGDFKGGTRYEVYAR